MSYFPWQFKNNAKSVKEKLSGWLNNVFFFVLLDLLDLFSILIGCNFCIYIGYGAEGPKHSSGHVFGAGFTQPSVHTNWSHSHPRWKREHFSPVVCQSQLLRCEICCSLSTALPARQTSCPSQLGQGFFFAAEGFFSSLEDVFVPLGTEVHGSRDGCLNNLLQVLGAWESWLGM